MVENGGGGVESIYANSVFNRNDVDDNDDDKSNVDMVFIVFVYCECVSVARVEVFSQMRFFEGEVR